MVDQGKQVASEGPTSQPLRGNVAAVVDRRELVLNIGEGDGVTQNMVFAVLHSAPLQLFDPTTGRDLGGVEIPKVFVKATRVRPQHTVARTFRKVSKNVGGTGGMAAMGSIERLFDAPRFVQVPEEFDTDGQTLKQQLREEAHIVRVGDPIVEVQDDDDFA